MRIDLVDRLRFDATRCELQFSKGIAGNIEEAAERIEALEKALRNIMNCEELDAFTLQDIARAALAPEPSK
jgi:hypothetical protein